jgi:hypothetical protein
MHRFAVGMPCANGRSPVPLTATWEDFWVTAYSLEYTAFLAFVQRSESYEIRKQRSGNLISFSLEVR